MITVEEILNNEGLIHYEEAKSQLLNHYKISEELEWKKYEKIARFARTEYEKLIDSSKNTRDYKILKLYINNLSDESFWKIPDRKIENFRIIYNVFFFEWKQVRDLALNNYIKREESIYKEYIKGLNKVIKKLSNQNHYKKINN